MILLDPVHLRIPKIRTCHRIELGLLHLEQGWNAWNTLLNEYGMVSVKEITVLGRKTQYLGFYWNTLENIENPNMPSNRAHLVTPETGLERLEHLVERMWDGFSRTWC